jgi:hypothetical protein
MIRQAALTLALLPAPAAGLSAPPVTAPDGPVVVYPGQLRSVDVLANDADPDGDELAICRLGRSRQGGVSVSPYADGLDVLADRRARPGSYTFTYYACDFGSLTPGTVTVEVRALPRVDVRAVRPGVVKVWNHAEFPIRFLHGDLALEGPDGVVRIAAGDRRNVRVARPVVDWMVFDRRGELYVDSGRLRVGYSAKASSGGQAQPRLRSPYAWSMRATGGQYLSGSMPVGKTPSSRS